MVAHPDVVRGARGGRGGCAPLTLELLMLLFRSGVGEGALPNEPPLPNLSGVTSGLGPRGPNALPLPGNGLLELLMSTPGREPRPGTGGSLGSALLSLLASIGST